MTMNVLQTKLQIKKARRELVNKRLSFIESPLRCLIRRFGFLRGMAIGDNVKSWDVLSTINFLDSHINKQESVLDIGCYASEVLVALHKLGYSSLTGADLNPNLKKMPYQDFINYEITDFMHTKFHDASFQAITSISVIEHGFDSLSLLKEMSRLLRPGGYFIASFDYWPEKIDTTGVNYFGMDWRILSKNEVVDFVAEAAKYSLSPVGEMMYEGKDKPIECGGRKYTFAWLVLRKST
ncbi:MAG: class I SAM-dependent methyltransferase [Phycisphaerae bacterium]|nr:class I SAM-dependent methyltransferase [Phycisphaerae bacterium]